MEIVQIATSYSERCGIGLFARNLENALIQVGIHLRTLCSVDAPIPRAALTLVHHEWSLLRDHEVRAAIASSPNPVVIFAHTGGGVERFSDVASGFVALAPGVIGPTTCPTLVLPCPARTPHALTDRGVLRKKYGYSVDQYTIGSSGFVLANRDFAGVLSGLLPYAARNNWRIELCASPWRTLLPPLTQKLQYFERVFPSAFRWHKTFLEWFELNERLQACDLLWCWTGVPSSAYASASISDLYASGSRIVATNKLQHAHVLKLPNVVSAPPRLWGFVRTLVAECIRRERSRHDPSPISWTKQTARLGDFFHSLSQSR